MGCCTPIGAATLTTSVVSSITLTSAVSGGNIVSDGGGAITQKGICWSTTTNPTISSPTKTTEGPGSGNFTSNLTGLTPGTIYYVRAYATNSAGTAYGNEVSFTTGQIVLATLTTTAISAITTTTATSGGNITADGGGAISARGVCWATTALPTISNFTASSGTGTGTFTSNITGLVPGTTYYVRAYATNSAGTAYGNVVSFTATAITLPTLTTTAVSAITITTATSGGNITADGNGTITARGVCWATTANPTTSNSVVSSGTGSGIFTSNLTGLTPGTTYYVRAYATNSAGTAYGTQVSFVTLPVLLPTVTTNTSITSLSTTTAVSGGDVTADGGGPITARGVCWATTVNPTTSNSIAASGTGTGPFTSNLTGLTPGTTYYIRAYATNSTGTSYGSQISFNTKVADVDGNTYNTVKIGTQVWMAENLNTTKYRNGDLIGTTSTITQDISAEVSPKYQWDYLGSPELGDDYGKMYTWYATTDSRQVCPTGFHMPSDAEWTVLKDFLGGEPVAGAKLKETGTTHWNAPNTTSTNETGFTAIPGGYRSDLGEYYGMGSISYHWSTTPHSPGFMWGQEMRENTISIVSGSYKPNNGMYVRCLKD